MHAPVYGLLNGMLLGLCQQPHAHLTVHAGQQLLHHGHMYDLHSRRSSTVMHSALPACAALILQGVWFGFKDDTQLTRKPVPLLVTCNKPAPAKLPCYKFSWVVPAVTLLHVQ